MGRTGLPGAGLGPSPDQHASGGHRKRGHHIWDGGEPPGGQSGRQSEGAGRPAQTQAADEAENASWQLNCIPDLFFFLSPKTAVAQQVSGSGSPTSVSCTPRLRTVWRGCLGMQSCRRLEGGAFRPRAALHRRPSLPGPLPGGTGWDLSFRGRPNLRVSRICCCRRGLPP